MSANDKVAATFHPRIGRDRMNTDLTHPPLTVHERRTVAALIRRRHPDTAATLLAALGLEDVL